MKLKFQATKGLTSYEATDVYAYDGAIVDVAPHRGMQLLEIYPGNFLEVGPPQETPAPQKKPASEKKSGIPPPKYTEPVHKPLSLCDITVIVINAYPDCFGKQLLPCIPAEVEFIPLENINNIYFTSAANALNYGIHRATNDLIMCVHVDTTLGNKWWENLIYWEARLENWGAFGISGWDFQNKAHFGSEFLEPFKIHCLDEDCIVVNRKNGISFDEETFKDWHCYGHDFSLQCWERGLPVYLVPGACNHTGIGTLTSLEFLRNCVKARHILRNKWNGKVPFINNGVDPVVK